jgi:hypothetical protein
MKNKNNPSKHLTSVAHEIQNQTKSNKLDASEKLELVSLATAIKEKRSQLSRAVVLEKTRSLVQEAKQISRELSGNSNKSEIEILAEENLIKKSKAGNLSSDEQKKLDIIKTDQENHMRKLAREMISAQKKPQISFLDILRGNVPIASSKKKKTKRSNENDNRSSNF